jgi:hypothetical protein
VTRRERLEAKVEKRRGWAGTRRAKAETLAKRAEPYRGAVACNTHPRHNPARARVIRALDKSFEHQNMANHHEAKAAGLEHQLERSVFSDDPDALEALAARIAELEAKREEMKASNAAFRKGDAVWAAHLGITVEQAAARRATVMEGYSWCRQPYPAYQLSNLGNNIKRLRDRVTVITARQQRTARAEASGGITIEGEEWVRITFAEKPSRSVLAELRQDFRWSGGSWIGQRAKIPACVLELLPPA